MNELCGLWHGNEFHEPVYCALCGTLVGVRCAEVHMTRFVSQSGGCTHIPKGGYDGKGPNTQGREDLSLRPMWG
jgi:hypothetical protein